MIQTCGVRRPAFGVGRLFSVLLVLIGTMTFSHAAEATLTMPDPLVIGVDLDGSLAVSDPPSRVLKVVLPEVPGLTWQVQGTSTQTTIINGKANSTESMRLAIRVDQAGTYRIPAITVRLGDGSSLSTKPVEVVASSGDASLSGEAKAEVIFEPDTIVPGQSTTMIFRVSLKQDRLRAMEEKPQIAPPSEAIKLGEPTVSSGSLYDAEGNQWTVRTWRWTITGSKPGAYPVGGQQTWYFCRQLSGFGKPILQAISKPHQVPVKPGTLTITALPQENRPDDFTGIIGTVTVNAALERQRIAVGEGTVLTVTMNGRAVELLSRPVLPQIPGLTAYPKDDPAPTNNDPDAEAKPTPGTRTFRWDLVPATPGEIALPTMSVPYFDPASRSYQRASSAPLTLTVIPGRVVAPVMTRPALNPTSAIAATTPAPLATMPPPWRGQAPLAIPWLWPLMALGFGVVLGCGSGLIAWWLRRPKSVGPRGLHIVAAMKQGRLDDAARVLQALMPTLTDANQRQAASAVLAAIDRARFGGQTLGTEVNESLTIVEAIQ